MKNRNAIPNKIKTENTLPKSKAMFFVPSQRAKSHFEKVFERAARIIPFAATEGEIDVKASEDKEMTIASTSAKPVIIAIG
jgi:hypothetical protein